MKRAQIFIARPWAFYLLMLVVMFLPYLGKLSLLGYSGDDYQVVFLARLGQPLDFWNYFVSDRPLSIWTYLLTIPWMGISSPPWQILTLVMRWLSVVGFMLAFQGLWPRRQTEIRWMGLLLAFYPGFHEQSQALAFSQHFITYALFTFSLAGMVVSQRKPAWAKFLVPLSVLASIANMATMEYFIGLEVLRPLILWFMIRKEGVRFRQTGLVVLKKWLPYLFALFLFAAWRFYFYPRITPEPERNNPVLFLQAMGTALTFLKELARMAFQDFLQVTVMAWTYPLTAVFTQSISLETALAWAAGLLIAFGLLWLLSPAPENDSGLISESDSFSRQGLLLGLLAVFAGGLPVWAIGRQAIEGGNSNRFSLAPMLGVIILVVCVLTWLAGRSTRRNLVLAVLLGLSIATQFRDTAQTAGGWQSTRQMFWELYWRAPALKPGTLVLGQPDLLVPNLALNVLYNPQLNPTQVSYWYAETIPLDVRPGRAIPKRIRNIRFTGSTSAILSILNRKDFGCLKVLTPDMQTNAWLTPIEQGSAALSNPGQIESPTVPPVIPPPDVFGREPARGWCYYYEKGALASQFKDWKQVAALEQAARQAGLA